MWCDEGRGDSVLFYSGGADRAQSMADSDARGGLRIRAHSVSGWKATLNVEMRDGLDRTLKSELAVSSLPAALYQR